jgi:hypothetical protein
MQDSPKLSKRAFGELQERRKTRSPAWPQGPQALGPLFFAMPVSNIKLLGLEANFNTNLEFRRWISSRSAERPSSRAPLFQPTPNGGVLGYS